MDTHTFPLPEVEVHKLDEVQEQITHSSNNLVQRTGELLRVYRWPLVAAGIAGLATAFFWWRSRA